MATVDTSIANYGLTADEIFLRAPRLNKDDVGECLTDSNIELIEEFEDAWKQFLISRPGTLPPGQKIKNFRNIQTRLNEIEGKKQNVCMELQRQLDLLASSRGKLEEDFDNQKQDATIQQKDLIRDLERKIDDIAMADKLYSEVLSWEHYFDNLESNTSTVHSDASLSTKTEESQVVKPTNEALYLANVKPSDIVDAARCGNSEARLLRAYRIDNALLKAKAAMMKREADRLEKNIRSDKIISDFLMENDIWGILASQKK